MCELQSHQKQEYALEFLKVWRQKQIKSQIHPTPSLQLKMVTLPNTNILRFCFTSVLRQITQYTMPQFLKKNPQKTWENDL